MVCHSNKCVRYLLSPLCAGYIARPHAASAAADAAIKPESWLPTNALTDWLMVLAVGKSSSALVLLLDRAKTILMIFFFFLFPYSLNFYCFIIMIVIDCKLMFHDRENITLFYCLVTNLSVRLAARRRRWRRGVHFGGSELTRWACLKSRHGINELWERRLKYNQVVQLTRQFTLRRAAAQEKRD